MTADEYIIKVLNLNPLKIVENSLNVQEYSEFKSKLYEAFGDERFKRRFHIHYKNIIKNADYTHILGCGSPVEGCKNTGSIVYSLTFMQWVYSHMHNKVLHLHGLKGNGKLELDDTKFQKLKMWRYIKNLYNNIKIHRKFVDLRYIKSLSICYDKCLVISCVNGCLDCNMEYIKLLKEKFPNSIIEFWVWRNSLYNKYKNNKENLIKSFELDLNKNKVKAKLHHTMKYKSRFDMYVYRMR